MKYCIIGFPRSRSSMLLETISLYYKIPILGEDINEFTNNSINKSPFYCYKDTTAYRLLLKKLLRIKQGVIRIHPLQISRPHWPSVNFDLYDFQHYDKIYFTFRESITDALASEFVARTVGRYTYMHPDALLKHIDPIEFNDDQMIRLHIYSENLVTQLKKYLKENGIRSEDLYYNDIPNYVNDQFPTVKTHHVETHYDYKKIITNYNDIFLKYEELKDCK